MGPRERRSILSNKKQVASSTYDVDSDNDVLRAYCYVQVVYSYASIQAGYSPCPKKTKIKTPSKNQSIDLH